MDDFVLMTFVGNSVDILCKMNPKHAKNVTTENGVKVLYVRLTKPSTGVSSPHYCGMTFFMVILRRWVLF